MTDVKKWLARYFDTSITNIENVLETKLATAYLLVWPIFEQKLFDGEFKSRNIDSKSHELAKYYDDLEIDNVSKMFHERYKDKQYLKHLFYKKDENIKEKMRNLILREFPDLSNEDKMYLLLCVTYRYRNNIFHGNKGVLSWKNYKEQIDGCLKFMMNLIDSVKINFKEEI